MNLWVKHRDLKKLAKAFWSILALPPAKSAWLRYSISKKKIFFIADINNQIFYLLTFVSFQNLYDFLSSLKHKRGYFEKFSVAETYSVHTGKTRKDNIVWLHFRSIFCVPQKKGHASLECHEGE